MVNGVQFKPVRSFSGTLVKASLLVSLFISSVPSAHAFIGQTAIFKHTDAADQKTLATLVDSGRHTELQHQLFYQSKTKAHLPYGLSHADAFYLMGTSLLPGKKYQQASVWFQKAAQVNHPWAQYQLSKLYQSGSTTLGKNQNVALELLTKAAKGNVPHAQLDLAMAYETGRMGLSKNLATALTYYQKAALNNHPLAQYALGYLYEKGRGVEKDLPLAFHWFKKAADQNLAAAQYKVGMYYTVDSEATRKNVAAAQQYLEKAANQNHTEAALQLGLMYEENLIASGNNHYDKAFYWYKKAANQGDSNGQMAVGTYYLMGWGTNQDMNEAMKWFKASANQGNDSAKEWMAILKKEMDDMATITASRHP